MSDNSALKAIEEWYGGLKTYAAHFPAKGTIGGALVVLERLKESFDLNIDSHTAEGGSQIIGTSGTALKNVLAEFGESRPFLSEGGRTNRGLRGDIKSLLDRLNMAEVGSLPKKQRLAVLVDLQSFLVGKVREFHQRQRMKIEYNPNRSARFLIRDLLDLAQQDGKEGPVAQHLVGAKLQLRFPHHQIGTESVSTADQQLGRVGDFLVGNTAFHITVAPMQSVFDKCKQNLHDGIRACLLVPDRRLQGARDIAEMNGILDQIEVEPIESFVATNIAEQSEFTTEQLAYGFLRLLDEYNRRIELVELDKSLLIEIPANLQRLRKATPGA